MGPVCHRDDRDPAPSAPSGPSAPSAQCGDHGGDHVEGAVDVLIGRAIPQCEAERTRRQLRGDTHGGEDMAGLERPAGARRPAGDADARLPQRHQELLALDTGDAQMEVARQHLDPGGGARR